MVKPKRDGTAAERAAHMQYWLALQVELGTMVLVDGVPTWPDDTEPPHRDLDTIDGLHDTSIKWATDPFTGEYV